MVKKKQTAKTKTKTKTAISDLEWTRICSAARYAWEEIHSDFIAVVEHEDHDTWTYTVRDVVGTVLDSDLFHRSLGTQDLSEKVSRYLTTVERYLVRNKSLWY
jgi:hypothetical protein